MQRNFWRIKCKHTPETVDKIMLSFRKRGLMIEALHYTKLTEEISVCEVEFIEDAENAERIRKNILRLEDLLEVEILKVA